MALTNSQYDVILREFEDKQNKNRHLLEERTAYVYEQVKGYRDIDESIASFSVEQGKKLLSGDENALLELRETLAALAATKKQLLLSAGLPQDYLEPVYDCPDCKDTGYSHGQKCHCFKDREITLLYEQSGIRRTLDSDNFSSLSYEYYQGEDLLRFQNAVTTCRNFVNNFNSDYHNLFFYGTVGTGKSFLSGCIARELIESGHSVIYFSASGLFDTLSKAKFDYRNTEELHKAYEDLFQCDLLIIDDLGTEYTNSFINSQLFSLINERHLAQKAIIISTNLSLEDFRNRYSDRIFSRITSHYEICKITGPDIRMYKKKLQNRK